MIDFKNKKILVIGLGKSGVASAMVLAKKGAIVIACDIKRPDSMREIMEELLANKIETLVGTYPDVKKEGYDMLVLSPGVPLTIEPVRVAIRQGIPVIGEIELAYLLKKPDLQMFAITGTNGKTTTTALLQSILKKSGINAIAAGNIGTPLTLIADSMEKGIISVELSSFQLETINKFKPSIASILNITPDHLDRHKTMSAYIKAKSNIFTNQDASDYAILNFEDKILRKLAEEVKASIIYFSSEQTLKEGVFIKDNIIMANINKTLINICNVDEILLKGKHNLENILCASAMALAAQVEPRHIATALKSFTSVRHRMEEIAENNGVIYVNDSKATNPESALKAIEAFTEPIILISGGRNKGASFDEFARALSPKVKALILLGEAKEEIKSAAIAQNYKNIYEVNSLDEGVRLAHHLSQVGDVVLLSPACASWDMFDNYEQRGDLFRELVFAICEGK
ncbi:MAG TPA: UDP-N-acetylmuramoyl-L-alanine--D-glutamate ligase [Syntrophomonadaceae bacterium]|nr:UDP-N-acetylmuramoyl-L-alanine--D-glutamate ligase [Syntrophomonadaceae bacterium]